MTYLPEEYNPDISPKEFELLVKRYIDELAKESKTSVITNHDVKLTTHDGEYQIDVEAQFQFLNLDFKILIECKKHKNPIKRDIVQVLHSKLQSSGAQKGAIFSTAAFQSGAINYAKSHGIALIRIIEGKTTYMTKGHNSEDIKIPEWANIPKFIGEYSIEGSICNLLPGHISPLYNFFFNDSTINTHKNNNSI